VPECCIFRRNRRHRQRGRRQQGGETAGELFRPFYGDDWILELDPDYRWALIGEPGRSYAWILAREPSLDAATLERLLARAAVLGFDREAFVRTPHGGPTR
jgi:apolipoprotein D and lipocalin family protein